MFDFSCWEIHDPQFRRYMVNSTGLEHLYSGLRWGEGPVYFGDTDILIFSDIPNDRMMLWADGLGTRTYRQPANYINGNTRDRLGRLVSCEHGSRRIVRTEIDGRLTVLADRYEGKRLNSPNDIAVKSDGSIWFTDPTYGILTDYEGYQADGELGANYVFRLSPDEQSLAIVSDQFTKPNGLAFSPDERILYISDTGATHDDDAPHRIMAFDVAPDNTLAGARVFADVEPGVPDGFCVDMDGNIWTSAADGVHCYRATDGCLLGKVRVPEIVSNVAFGGKKRNRLFITATTSLYSVYVGVSGCLWP